MHCVLCGLLWRYGKGWTDYLLLGGLAVAWGIGDAAFNTQISALLGIFYPEDTVRYHEYHTHLNYLVAVLQITCLVSTDGCEFV